MWTCVFALLCVAFRPPTFSIPLNYNNGLVIGLTEWLNIERGGALKVNELLGSLYSSYSEMGLLYY